MSEFDAEIERNGVVEGDGGTIRRVCWLGLMFLLAFGSGMVSAEARQHRRMHRNDATTVRFDFWGLRAGLGWNHQHATSAEEIDSTAWGASYNQIGFESIRNPLPAPYVYFEYTCEVQTTSDGSAADSGIQSSFCPGKELLPNVKYLRVFGVRLLGPDAPKYHARDKCWSTGYGFPNKNQWLYEGQHEEGENCGLEQNGFWLTRIKLWLCPGLDPGCPDPTPD
jgi:hypothetical protein